MELRTCVCTRASWGSGVARSWAIRLNLLSHLQNQRQARRKVNVSLAAWEGCTLLFLSRCIRGCRYVGSKPQISRRVDAPVRAAQRWRKTTCCCRTAQRQHGKGYRRYHIALTYVTLILNSGQPSSQAPTSPAGPAEHACCVI
jgi:hypothetical protein